MASSRWPDAGIDAFAGAAAVAFEVELAFEGVVDRFDPLADPADRSVAGRLVAAVRADQVQPVAGGEQVLELAPGEALVADEGQPPAAGHGCGGRGRAGRRPPRVPRAAGWPGTRRWVCRRGW